jgi:hypothetical protein
VNDVSDYIYFEARHQEMEQGALRMVRLPGSWSHYMDQGGGDRGASETHDQVEDETTRLGLTL